MKEFMLKLSRWFLALMGLGGAFSCNGLFVGRDEYGTPYSTFQVKGKVVDSESGAPVKGVTMTPCHTYSDVDENGVKVEVHQPMDEGVEVDDKGTFVIGGTSYSADTSLSVLLHDEDPETDGHYKDSVYVVELEPVEGAKDEDAWHVGSFAANVVLKAEPVHEAAVEYGVPYSRYERKQKVK